MAPVQSTFNMAFIVDVQGFQFRKSPFYVKEICILNIANGEITHKQVSLPFAPENVTPDFLSHLINCMRRVHGLDYDAFYPEEDIHYSAFSDFLKDILFRQDSIAYVIDNKDQILKELLSSVRSDFKCRVVGLRQCPQIDNLKCKFTPEGTTSFHCNLHFKNGLRCARENALLVHKWFQSRL